MLPGHGGRLSLLSFLSGAACHPQVVLGADVFYSSEHFDSVLATAFMLLSAVPCASGVGGGGGCGGAGVGVNVTTDAAGSMPCGVIDGAAGAGEEGVFLANNAAAASTADSAAAVTTPPASSSKQTTGVADNTAATSSNSCGSPFSVSKSVFLTAYHERSARRSLRPLLRKWGMEARVLHDVPRRVLPPALWESGRYDSVALIEITLTQYNTGLP